MRSRKRNKIFGNTLVLFLVLFLQQAIAQQLNPKLVSAFVYNFTQNISWPASQKTGTFVIGVYKSAAIADNFTRAIANRMVGDQSIVLKTVENINEQDKYSILFIPLKESGSIPQISQALKGKPILIISEKPGLWRKGSSINLFLDEDDDYKTKFELNKTAIESTGMLITNKLLQLAATVK